jgi:hypothetical protein
MNISINQQSIAVQGVRELRPGISIEQAIQKTKRNGLDEVFFKANGRAYVAYGDAINISKLKKNEIPAIMFNGLQADMLAFDDESNSIAEGAYRGALNELGNAVGFIRTSVSNILGNVGPTVMGVAAVGGVGVGVYTLWKRSQGAAIGSALVAQTGQKTIQTAAQNIPVSQFLNGLKITALAGLAGAGVLAAYGALKGAFEAKANAKDYASIASISADGSAPANGGAALSWQQLNGQADASPQPPSVPVPDNDANSGIGIGFGVSVSASGSATRSQTLMDPRLLRR